MKKVVVYLLFSLLVVTLPAQNAKTIALHPPDTTRGTLLMQAIAQRASAREFDTTNISIRDLSDLLWVANGINRPVDGKRTAPSALNAQDIDLYIATKSAIYLYNSSLHLLDLVVEGDYRNEIAGKQESMAKAPLFILLVSDISRFRTGEENQRLEWAALDAGFVAQNILLFCASESLACRPRSWMGKQKLKEILMLKQSQYLMLNIPVSYGTK